MLESLKVAKSQVGLNFVQATLAKDVMFVAPNGFQVRLPKGSTVVVDEDESVAFCYNYHFDIEASEYTFDAEEDEAFFTSNAVSTKAISFTNSDGLSVLVPKGSVLHVDKDAEIAFYNGHHFDIASDEFNFVS